MSNVSQLQAANNKEIVFKNKFRCSPSAALWFRCLCLLVLIKTPICIFNLTTSLSFLRVCSLRNWIWFSIHWAEFNYVYGSTAGGISASSKLIFQHFSNTSPPASAITYHQRISRTENPENGQVQKIRTRRLFSSNRTRASLPLNWTESGKLNASRNFLRLCALICRCYNKGHKKVGGFFCGGGSCGPRDSGRLLHVLGCCTGDLGSRNPFALRAFYFIGAMSNVSIWKALKSATESNGNPPKFTSVAECFLTTPAPYLFLSLCLRSLSVVIRLFVNNPDCGDSATCTPRTSGKSNDQDVLQNIHTYMYAQWIYRFQNSTFKAFNTTLKGRCLSIHSNNLF